MRKTFFQKRTLLASKSVNSECGNMLSDTSTLMTLTAENIDLVISDGNLFCYCYFVVPYILKVPYVAVSSICEDFVTGRPFLPSISPYFLSHGTNRMTFPQRVKNALSQIFAHTTVRYLILMDFVSTLALELTRNDIINIASKFEFYLYNYDAVLSYPLPQMPSLFVDGVGTGQPQPLTGELKNYVQESIKGVVLVTFGGKSINLPAMKVKELMRVFQKLQFNEVWKNGDGGQNGNVKQMRWVPQNDILGHPSTKVFVSHCGNNGIYEALYHGGPLVCTPMFGDQFFNGDRVERWKVGISASLMESSESQLHNAITEVLKQQRASAMYHSQPQPPRKRAA